LISARSREKSLGRLDRSVEMMTQRPVMGSFLSSGTLLVYNRTENVANGNLAETAAVNSLDCL
jgi:hypothetical protein